MLFLFSHYSSLIVTEQFDRTLCECPCIVSACQISPKQDHPYEVVTSVSKLAAMESPDWGMMMALCANQTSQNYLNPPLMYISTSHFVAPYQNSTSGFDFDVCIFIVMSFCISLPNFVVIERLGAVLWHHIEYSKWQPQSRKSTSSFGFSNSTRLRRWKSICIPNFGEIP